MSDNDNDYSEQGNFDEDNMGDDLEDGDQDPEDVSSRSGDSSQEESDGSNNSDSDPHSDSENEEYAEEAGVQILASGERETIGKAKVTPPFLTKYEKARIIGTRALQIA